MPVPLWAINGRQIQMPTWYLYLQQSQTFFKYRMQRSSTLKAGSASSLPGLSEISITHYYQENKSPLSSVRQYITNKEAKIKVTLSNEQALEKILPMELL